MQAKAPSHWQRNIRFPWRIIEGPVKIVDSAEDVYAVKPGDIVVVKYSNPCLHSPL